MRAEDHRRDLTRDSERAGPYTFERAGEERLYLLCLCKTRAQKIFKPVSPLPLPRPPRPSVFLQRRRRRGGAPVIVIDNRAYESFRRETATVSRV